MSTKHSGEFTKRSACAGVALISLASIALLYVTGSIEKVNSIFTASITPEVSEQHHQILIKEDLCPQPSMLDPPKSNVANASIFLTEEYRKHSVELLGGAVRIPTVSYDDLDMDPLQEPRLEIFSELHKYLIEKFPLVSKHLEIINTYGLLYTLKGSDPSLKPAVFMAHQDVVPVEKSTVKDWEHPPFSGFFDGTYIWGRGTEDTKNSLVAILEATESLLEQKHEFTRDVIISFGFDEEVGGFRGAYALANTIRERYGEEDSVEFIVDEGSSVTQVGDAVVGAVGVTEKGYLDINLILHTPGGHSSVPPDHTGVGIMSALLVEIENAHIANTKYSLSSDDVTASLFQCLAKYDTTLDEDTYNTYTDVSKLSHFLKNDISKRPLISTTQAIDVISGGVKINALPEQVKAAINHRVDVHETTTQVRDNVAGVIADVLKTGKFGSIGLKVNGETILEGDTGTFIEVNNGETLEPAPISPYDPSSRSWQLLAGTTAHTLEEWFDIDYAGTVPLLMTGNTDTSKYLGLTRDIYRYTVGLPNSGAHAHTVNEYISLESHLASVVWFYELLQYQ